MVPIRQADLEVLSDLSVKPINILITLKGEGAEARLTSGAGQTIYIYIIYIIDELCIIANTCSWVQQH